MGLNIKVQNLTSLMKDHFLILEIPIVQWIIETTGVLGRLVFGFSIRLLNLDIYEKRVGSMIRPLLPVLSFYEFEANSSRRSYSLGRMVPAR